MSDTLVVAYGDVNALRRGVAHAVLRDLMLHGPLEPDGARIEHDPIDWIDRYAELRAGWLSETFGIDAARARTSIDWPLRALCAADIPPIEIVLDEQECIDCRLAHRLIATIAAAAGNELADPTDEIGWDSIEASRTHLLVGLDDLLRSALEQAAAAGGSVADAWQIVSTADSFSGISDMGACVEFSRLLQEGDIAARLDGVRGDGDLPGACARGVLHTIRLA